MNEVFIHPDRYAVTDEQRAALLWELGWLMNPRIWLYDMLAKLRARRA